MESGADSRPGFCSGEFDLELDLVEINSGSYLDWNLELVNLNLWNLIPVSILDLNWIRNIIRDQFDGNRVPGVEVLMDQFY